MLGEFGDNSCSAHAYFDASFAYGVYIAGGNDNNSGRNFFIIPKQTFETLHEPNMILCQFHLIQVSVDNFQQTSF
jgi:hypothetical protein